MTNFEKYNILPSITVGQAILESNWGQSKLTKDSNNIFGIKAVDSAPETLNTLNELSAALGDDPNFATTIATQLGNVSRMWNRSGGTSCHSQTNVIA